MEIDPDQLTTAERYQLLIGGIVPRPIALISTISPEGRTNLAPYSFFNGIGSNPMSLLFCAVNNRRGEMKDTLRHALPPSEGGSGEFVVNIAIESYAASIARAAESLAYGESEFPLSGLTPVASTHVQAPRVLESPIAYECRTLQVIRLADGMPGGGNIVIGRVLRVHVREDLIDESYRLDPQRLTAIGVMGGMTYLRTHDRFEIPIENE